ncbi:MAG: hypothetical protein J5449_05505 [Oscillospiraceae bacterium]|nr:hypothetical protein [Oscillospiraceae bacterium]
MTIDDILLALTLPLMWFEIFLVVRQDRERRRMAQRVFALLVSAACFAAFQLALQTRGAGRFVPEERAVYAAFLALAAAALLYQVLEERAWGRGHITALSVRESLDTLPVGLCVYRKENGMPLLVNPMADRVSMGLTKKPLTNGKLLHDELFGHGGGLRRITGSEGTTVFSVSFGSVSIEGRECGELLFHDVTDLERVNEQLRAENARLRRMNERALQLNRTIDAVTIEGEMLKAKARVHDELGQALIATRRYLVSGKDSASDERELIAMWRESAAFMTNVSFGQRKDAYLSIRETAEDVGVSLELTGELPQSEPAKQIAATAMHECLTNALRHAGGDRLFINCAPRSDGRQVLTISNNGRPPEGPIRETGGLATLRALTEREGGTMELDCSGRFKLTITMP